MTEIHVVPMEPGWFSVQVLEGALDTAPRQRQTAAPLRIRIQRHEGSVVRDYTLMHESDLHLIVVGHDLVHYQHLHPAPLDDGTWVAHPIIPNAGEYRVIAEFTPAPKSDAVTVHADIAIVGDARPVPLPEPLTTTHTDSYRVQISSDLHAGTRSRVRFTVERHGAPVRNLDAYLGACGHLVVIRASDLEYLHVHPVDSDDDATIVFAPRVPTTGRYRLFLDFSHEGVVHTAAFTADVTMAANDWADQPPHD